MRSKAKPGRKRLATKAAVQTRDSCDRMANGNVRANLAMNAERKLFQTPSWSCWGREQGTGAKHPGEPECDPAALARYRVPAEALLWNRGTLTTRAGHEPGRLKLSVIHQSSPTTDFYEDPRSSLSLKQVDSADNGVPDASRISLRH